MKRTLSLLSLLVLTISNSFAGVINYSKLTENEQEFIEANIDNQVIIYDASTNDIIIDNDLEKQLRDSGILTTVDGVGSSICRGGGSGGA